MWDTRLILIPMILSLPLIGSGCIFQAKESETKKYNFIDYDSPALRLAEPTNAKLLWRNPETGKWESVGKGTIPAGAYIKGRKPQPPDPTQESPEKAIEKGE